MTSTTVGPTATAGDTQAEARALRKSILTALRTGAPDREDFERTVGGLVALALPDHAAVLRRYLRLREANARKPFQVKVLRDLRATGRRGGVRIMLIETNSAYSNTSRQRRYLAPYPRATTFRVDVIVTAPLPGDSQGFIASGGDGSLADARRAFREYTREFGPR